MYIHQDVQYLGMDVVVINPGGRLPLDRIRGRAGLVAAIIDTLRGQSVLLTAERRMGKTSVLRLVEDGLQRTEGFVAVHTSVEKVATPGEFVEVLGREILGRLPTSKRVSERIRGLAERVSGDMRAGPFTLTAEARASWKTSLEHLLRALDEHVDEVVVLMLDEVPFMLAKLRDPEEAGEVLDFLRDARHRYERLRMVLTGSIGLHHVVERLRAAAVVRQATNDLLLIDVPPLASEDAESLAHELLHAAGVAPPAEDVVAHLVAAVEAVPYYLHHVAKALQLAGDVELDRARVDQLVQDAIEDPHDRWMLHHYVDRLDDYYDDRADLAAAVLGAIAAGGPLHFDQLEARLRGRISNLDQRQLRQLLDLLQRDHYLRSRDGAYGFRLELVRRVWRQLRPDT